MGDNKLYLLLLLCIIVFSDAQEDSAPCLLAKRYKTFQKYEYLYEAESLNSLNGAVNGPRASCKVEIEVPSTCSYVVHTKECTLSEVMYVDDNGSPVFGPAAGAENFKAEMEKNPLKVIVEGDNDIKLFPEDDELINILNIKRGIISALAVPVLEEKKNKRMPTIYGLCNTEYTVNSREDIATDVTLNRDLSGCDNFRPIKDHTSPLALITGMHYPLAQLIRSKQTCNYKFDNQLKHMTSGVCSENHILKPFSHKGTIGVTTVGKQMLSLLGVTVYNERVFDHNEANMKPLHLDASVDMSPDQNEAAVLDVLKELVGLSQNHMGERRAHLAHKLVAAMRKMNTDTLSATLPEALVISPALTYQALFQCGTPECSSAMLQVLRTIESTTAEIDAAVYALGMVPNPSRALVKEMLEMAKFKPSKPIYYATSNAVRRLYKAEGKVTPEIQAVAEYVMNEIGDCTEDQEHIYLTLRVIGNMAAALGAASPALKSAVIQCISQTAASPEVQQAAIQVFKLTPVPEEGRTVLMQVVWDGAAPIQKRIAAYLILMKDPQPAELTKLATTLPTEKDPQFKSFIVSHITNILDATDSETKELRLKINDAFQNNKVEKVIGKVMDPTKFSRNYKIGSLEGNMIFESANKLPKEVMLEMTLNAFGYDIDMFEVGMESKGFEPTVEALFGPNGFFPDTVMKTIYYTAEKMPPQVTNVLKKIIPGLRNDRKKREVSQNIMKEITQGVDKLFEVLKTQDAPEAMLYLRLLGNELGYLKTRDVEEIAYSVAKTAENLQKMFPTDFIKNLFSSTDNEVFLHYIFMDNEFYLPTGSGLPLRVALSGTFTPGVKGGLKIAPDMSEIAFMPSAGVEFVTEFGAHFPDYVHSGLEMHTNIYHESSLNAKLAMTKNQIKLSIPAPEKPIKLISVTNSLVSVAGSKTNPIPALGERKMTKGCTPLLPGLTNCNVLEHSYAALNDEAPYFPLTGDSKFAIEIHSSGEVSEYTASITYALVEKVDKVTVDIKAEEIQLATANMMYNRKKFAVSADFQIPDFDIDAGIRIGAADPNSKATHSIQIDLLNKNVPKASLVALAKIKTMKDAMLQVQMLIPSLQTDAKVRASLKRTKDMRLELESDLKFLDTSSLQKFALKYDVEKIEAEMKSDISSKTQNIMSQFEFIKNEISEPFYEYTGLTEQKVYDAITSSVEVTNSYLEASKIPFVKNLRVPAFKIEVPETLFFNIDVGTKYNFGKSYYNISLPMPFGGKFSKDLNIPPALVSPRLSVPQIGLEVDSIRVPLPEFFIPETVTVSVPVLGKAEVDAKLSSNLYDLEATLSAGKDPTEHQSYSAKVNVIGKSPVELLSFAAEGSALLGEMPDDTLKAEVNSAVMHKLIDARLDIVEEIEFVKKLRIKSSSKLEAIGPLGVKFSLEHSGQVGNNADVISGDSNLKASFGTGPVTGNATLTHSLTLRPFSPEAKIKSSLQVDSTLLQTQNTIAATLGNGELSVTSTTATFGDMLTHSAEISFRDSKLAVKSGAKAMALGMTIQNIAEASVGVGNVDIMIETSTADSKDRIKSVITATLDKNGLVVTSSASGELAKHSANHKASLSVNKNGLVTRGTTLVNSLLTLNNSFHGVLHSSEASLTVQTKSQFANVELDTTNSMSASMSSVSLTSKTRIYDNLGLWYNHDISAQAEPYSATMSINNEMAILPLRINNEAKFKAEPYTAELTGSLKLATKTEELKHTYEISYADLTAAVKSSTSGKLLGTHMSHNTEMEIAGLAFRVSNSAQFNSQDARFDTTLKATAAPFSFNMQALANGDGELNLFGKHTAQVYTKILLKAEPLSLAHSHECRVSTTYEQDKNVIIETNFDNKVDTLLTPSEQSATIRMKSKINNNAINQELDAYNNNERIGVEVSSFVTGIAAFENQDVSLSAFLKYDKNTESHVISIPFVESLPAVLENLKITAVAVAESMQNYINTEDFVNKIQTLLQNINEFVTDLNLEEKVVQLKEQLIMFSQEYAITCEDLEASVMKLRTFAQKIMTDLVALVGKVEEIVKNIIVKGALSDQVIQMLNEQFDALDYDITGMLHTVIKAIEDFIKQIDMSALKDSYIGNLLNDLNEEYSIKEKLEDFMSQLKQMIANFDKAQFIEDVKTFVTSINIQDYTEQLMAKFPTEEMNKVADRLKQLITELDIIDRCKDIYNNVRAFLMKYEVEAFLDKIVDLIKKLKIDKTVQGLLNSVKSIWISFTNMLDKTITYLKTTEVKGLIEDFNKYLDAFINRMKSFDYNAFVDEANQKIKEYTAELNKLIESHQLPQILKETREFINFVLSSVSDFWEDVRALKITDLKNILDIVVLNDLKAFAEKVSQKLADVDLRGEMNKALKHVSGIYAKVLIFVTDAFNKILNSVKEILGDQPFVTELNQIIEGIVTGLKTTELELPSFTVPLTDLVLPAMKVSLQQLQETELPTQFDIPQFTILGVHTVPAMTITFDDIKQKITDLLQFIANLDIERFFAYYEEFTLNYLPKLTPITLPEVTITDISFISIPKLNDKFSLDIPLQIPEIQLPKIPTAVLVPAFGKLYSEIRLNSPIYTFRTSAEIQNSTDNEQMHHFTAYLSSSGISPKLPILTYNLDATARIGMPKLSRVVIAETLRFIHSALSVEHQASVTFYGLSAQANAQTVVKATTTPYKANIVNKAFLAAEGGMTASSETTYKHEVNIPSLSLTSEATLTQSAVTLQKDAALRLTVTNSGNMKVTYADFSDEMIHKSDLVYTMNLKSAKLTFSGDTDSATLQIKERLNINAITLSHIDFNGRIDTQSPYIKNSIIVASGRAHLGEKKVQVDATHDTELVGAVSGTLSNAISIMVRPFEIIVDLKNKGNGKVSLEESLSAKIDLQSDNALILNSKNQHINTYALLRYKQYKYSYNFTIDNNNAEAGIYAAINGETDLDFLTTPISIMKIDVPIFNIMIPAINNLNLYEDTVLKYLLTTTRQTIDVVGTMFYRKSRSAPIVDLGIVRIPAVGNFISQLSFKSPVLNLNANAEITGEDDLAIRVAATSTSVYQALRSKLEGTSSLTVKRGLKVANALSLENVYIMGSHNSTMTVNTDNLEASAVVATKAKLDIPILTFEANHKLQADTKTNQKTASTLTIIYTFDVPIINSVGSGNYEHIFKLDATNTFISLDTATKGMIDGTLLDTGIVKGDLDNEANFYLNGEGLRSKQKTAGNVDINFGDLKVKFDVNENMDLEAALGRIYAVLRAVSNNEVNFAALNTKGKHAAKATVDLDLKRSFTADVEYDLSQPSLLGDLSIYEKTLMDFALSKQNIAYITRIVTPLYSTNVTVDVEGIPVFKVAFKSSAKSPFVILGHNLDSYISVAVENKDLTATAKASLEHEDVTMDLSSVFALSEPSHTLNVDLISPTFTNVKLRYSARRDGMRVSVLTPSAPTLNFEVLGEFPSHLKARFYVPSEESELNILMVRVSADEKVHLQAVYNLHTQTEILQGLKNRVPKMMSSVRDFAEKYGISGVIEGLKTVISTTLNEILTYTNSHSPDLSQLSVFFRKLVVPYQKAIQHLLSTAVKFLRETQIKLPGMEASTLPQICQKIKKNVTIVLRQIFKAITDNMDAYFSPIVKSISTVQITLPSGEVKTAEQIYSYVKSTLKSVLAQTVNIVKQLECLDVILEKLSHAVQKIVEKAQEFVDTIKFDISDDVMSKINQYYTDMTTITINLTVEAKEAMTIDNLNAFIDDIFSKLIEHTEGLIKILPREPGALVKYDDNEGQLEIELPCPFHM